MYTLKKHYVYTEKKQFKNEKSLVNFTYNYKSGK